MTDLPIETFQMAMEVEQFVNKQFEDAAQYENSEVLDASGVYALHELVAKAYARGWQEGHIVGRNNERNELRRKRPESMRRDD